MAEIEYEIKQQERIKNSDGTNSTVLKPAVAVLKPITKKKASAEKEIIINNTIADRDDQLNLMASTIMEILVHLGLTSNPTPSIQLAIDTFEAIQVELNK